MAELYCDHGAYGTGTGVYGATPAWGVPQEGDGTATAASTTASTAAILLNGQPTAGQTVSICGVSFSAVASGATGNQFNIGASLDITANNLATAINASTTAVSSTIATGTPKLRNLVYARGPSGGAPSATCQLMMRVGSAALNSSVNNQIVSTFGTAPTITQWNGGVGGCFGYFLNDVTLGAGSDFSILTYGALTGIVAHAGATTTANDALYVRTGTNKTISVTLSSGVTLQRGTGYLLRTYFDTNTKWTGDDPSGTLTLSVNHGLNTLTLSFVQTFNLAFYSQCLRRGNFKVVSPTSGLGNITMGNLVGSSNFHCEGWAFVDNNSSGASNIVLFPTGSNSNIGNAAYVNCDYSRPVAQASIPNLMTILPSGTCGRYRADGCTFTYTISGTSDPGALFGYAAAGGVGPNAVHFTNCQFIANGYSSGLNLFPSGVPTWAATTSTFYDIRIENCTGLRYPTAFAGLVTATSAVDQDAHSLYMNLGATGFRFENCRGLCDFDPTVSPPMLGATMPDGATPWSLRTLWVANGSLGFLTPFATPAMRIYNRLATGARTVGLEFTVPAANTLTDTMMRFVVSYVDSTGTPRVESTSTVSSSSSSWTNQGTNVAKKITLTTANSVLTNTEIICRLELTAAPSTGSNTNLYLNPEPSLS